MSSTPLQLTSLLHFYFLLCHLVCEFTILLRSTRTHSRGSIGIYIYVCILSCAISLLSRQTISSPTSPGSTPGIHSQATGSLLLLGTAHGTQASDDKKPICRTIVVAPEFAHEFWKRPFVLRAIVNRPKHNFNPFDFHRTSETNRCCTLLL